MFRLFTAVALLALLSTPVRAEDPPPTPTIQYIELRPSFVTNYGQPSTNKLRYIKADVSLRVSSPESAAVVERHMPLIRNQIVRLLSQQSETNIADFETQETIRQTALVSVNAALKAEENKDVVEDLLFTNFVTQQ